MKNIFYFNAFINESNDQEWSKNENIIEEIKETFLELIDDEFSVNIKKYTPLGMCQDTTQNVYYLRAYKKVPDYNTIFISIRKIHFAGLRLTFFTINDVKDTLETSISYLNEVYGLKIDKIIYTLLREEIIVTNFSDIDYNLAILGLKIFLK